MTVVTDPRDLAFARINPARVAWVTNSSVAFAATKDAAYRALYGIPGGNVLSWPLGTSYLTNGLWDPGSNAAITTFADALKAVMQAIPGGCQGVILGCATPARVRSLGLVSGGTYNPATVCTPSLAELCSGALCFSGLSANGRCGLGQFEDGVLACVSAGSGNFLMRVYSPNLNQVKLLFGYWLWEKLGYDFPNAFGDIPNGVAELRYAGSERLTFAWGLPKGSTTLKLGDAETNVVPVGRFGWTQYNGADGGNHYDTEANLDALLTAIDDNSGVRAQPGPVLVSLKNVSGGLSDADIYAMLYKRMTEWGFSAKYFYRQSPNALQSSLCPVGGPDMAFTREDYEGGAVTDYDYYYLAGCGQNEDLNATLDTAPYATALRPIGGGLVGMFGPSSGYRHATLGMKKGGVAGFSHFTHITATQINEHFLAAYLLLGGMSLLEASYWERVSIGISVPCGDPLFRPFEKAVYLDPDPEPDPEPEPEPEPEPTPEPDFVGTFGQEPPDSRYRSAQPPRYRSPRR